MTALSAQARIVLPDPAAILVPLCAHLAEHGGAISMEAGARIIELGYGKATLRPAHGWLDARIDADDLQGLQETKFAISSHIAEFAPPDIALAILWEGDGPQQALLPDFRILTVTEARDLTPHMRRVYFRGDNLARYDTLETLHVRLFIPPAGLGEPQWPMLGPDGLVRHPPIEARPFVRKYTIREIDVSAGTLAIDFVMHDDAGPGSAFARHARPGALIGMAGPGGRGLAIADSYVFLCDETGLPAVARMLENLPAGAQGTAIIEVADRREEQALTAPPGVSLRWLHRNGAEAGTTTLLQDAFDALPLPGGDRTLYLWCASEHASFKHLRANARRRVNPDRHRHLVVSYWRRGESEDQHAREKAASRANTPVPA